MSTYIKNKYFQLFLIFTLFTGSLSSQTWRKYNLQTGELTTVIFSYVTTGNSANTNGNKGVLNENASSDTSRGFFPLDIVNDANAYPWRTSVKFNDVSGTLIDPYHVLVAGHTLEFNQWYANVQIIPSYNSGNMPYNCAYPQYFYLLTNFASGTATDIGIIKLDRPIGSLTGWNGFGFNTDNNFFYQNVFFNPSYPSANPFNDEYLFAWKGIFSNVSTDYLFSTRTGYGGMSGAGAYTKLNGDNVLFGFITNMGVKFNRITAAKFDAINAIISDNTPSTFDMIPLFTNVSPKILKSGNSLDSLSFVILNYSSENKSNANITANVYLSNDMTITETDELIGTYNFSKNLNAKSSELIKITSSLPVLSKPIGTYYIGIILSGDINTANNIVNSRDVAQLIINNTDNYTIKGKVNSTQSNCGISGVQLSGFPSTVVTDYKGEYETQIPFGWSGNISLSKTGFDFNPSTTNYLNINSNTITNYNTNKKINLLSGYVKSPIAQTPVNNVKLTGLVGEPYTDANGAYSVPIYFGWSGTILPTKGNVWNFQPQTYTLSNVSTNNITNFAGGFYIRGACYNSNSIAIQDALISGLPPGNILSDINGNYSSFIDSGWSGTVTPLKTGINFNPQYRNYTNLNATYNFQDYVQNNNNYLNLKLLFSGAIIRNDTMKTSLNYSGFLPKTPPDTLSGKVNKFIYNKNPDETVSLKFFQLHRDIVDWIIIELRETRYYTPVDTFAAFLRQDGKVLDISGNSLIQMPSNFVSGDYFVVIRHRNHLAVMSAVPVNISSAGILYDFTTGLNKYFGGDAKKISDGIYGLYGGDANQDGAIDESDLLFYNTDLINAKFGYFLTDFSLDGYITGTDFNILAPNRKNHLFTNIP